MTDGDRSRGPIPVAAVLPDVLEDLGVLRQVQRMGAVELWPEIVGEHVARVTSARNVEDARLFVEVRSSAWLTELNMMKRDFLRRVNEHMDDTPLERIVFVLAETE